MKRSPPCVNHGCSAAKNFDTLVGVFAGIDGNGCHSLTNKDGFHWSF
jgi:hypothetical protein